MYILYKQKRAANWKMCFAFSGCLLLLFLSSSGTGYFLMLIFLGLAFLVSDVRLRWKVMICFILVAVFHLTLNAGLFSAPTGRGPEIAIKLLKNPFTIIGDTSVAYRIFPLLTGVFSVLHGDLIGNGAGSMSHVSVHYLPSLLLQAYNVSYEKIAALGSSALGQYATEMGLIFIIPLIWLYLNYNRHKYALIIRCISLAFLMASFSIVFPPLWVLLAATHKPRYKTFHVRQS